MIIRSIPAGLLNDQVEFFNDPENQEHAYFLTSGKVGRVKDAPHWLRSIILNDIAGHPEKAEALVELGYVGEDEQLEKYISCISGAFDGEADITDIQIHHTEFWLCPHRGICPVEGKLCNALVVGHEGKHLTRREIDTLIQASKGLQNKEIAAVLQVSEETVKVFIKHIHDKAGINNRAELTILALKKNLIAL